MHNRRKKSLERVSQDNLKRRTLVLKDVAHFIKRQYRNGRQGVCLDNLSNNDYELIVDFIPKILITLGIKYSISYINKPVILIDFKD